MPEWAELIRFMLDNSCCIMKLSGNKCLSIYSGGANEKKQQTGVI